MTIIKKATWDDLYQIKFRNTHKVRQAAINFEEKGMYTPYEEGDTLFDDYWDQQERLSLYGGHFPIGPFGESIYIPGYYYWYLNFSPIMKLDEWQEPDVDGHVDYGNAIEENSDSGIVTYNDLDLVTSDRIEGFPDFWDGDFWHFKYTDDAERLGKFGIELKVRGVGFSFKGGSMPTRNYFLIPKSKSFLIADDKDFLLGDGVLQKAWSNMSFVDKHTPWAKRRQYQSTSMSRRASFEEEVQGIKSESGFLSAITGITTKNDPNKVRGIRGKLIYLEEGGKDPHLVEKWMILQESVKRGRRVFGFMLGGGCVCAGTKVWANNGDLINIEDLKQEQGIIGYNKEKGVISKEPISYYQKPIKKECYRITTNTGRYLECSDDHPILKSVRRYPIKERESKYRDKGLGRKYRKQITDLDFVRTDDLKIGDKIAIADSVKIFGDKIMWEPRLIGWLIGDGSYGKNKTPILSNCEPEINDYIRKNFDTTIEKNYLTKGLKVYEENRIRSICPKLRELGIYGQTKKQKRLPNDIHSYNKNDIYELIGGLFDTDGHVSLDGAISITSLCYELLDEIRFLCQKIGIHGGIYRKEPNPNNPIDKNPYYYYQIKEKESVLRFANSIKLYPKEKQRRLDSMNDYYKDKGSQRSKDIKGVKFERIVSIICLGKQNVYNLTADNTHTYIANGIVTHNTGGTEGADYEGLNELFWNPDGYNIFSLNNRWSKGSMHKKVGFFWPCTVNAETYMDKDGNSDQEASRRFEESERAKIVKSATKRDTISRYKAERPFTPEEATLNTSKNIFPTEMLIEHLNDVETDPIKKFYGQSGYLYINKDLNVSFRQSDKHKAIDKFPLESKDNQEGAVVIYDYPVKHGSGMVPDDLYFISVDPYYQDKSTGPSLGAVYVYKKVNSLSTHRMNTICAVYVGRPDTLNEFLRILFLLSDFYNAKIAIENDKGRSIIEYARAKKKLSRLFREAEFKYNTDMSKPRIKRGFGIKMASGKDDIVRNTGEQYLADWLKDVVYVDEEGREMLVLHTIYDIPTLQELIAYNKDGNYDRVDALIIMQFYIKETLSIAPKTRKEESPESYFSADRARHIAALQQKSTW